MNVAGRFFRIRCFGDGLVGMLDFVLLSKHMIKHFVALSRSMMILTAVYEV